MWLLQMGRCPGRDSDHPLATPKHAYSLRFTRHKLSKTALFEPVPFLLSGSQASKGFVFFLEEEICSRVL